MSALPLRWGGVAAALVALVAARPMSAQTTESRRAAAHEATIRTEIDSVARTVGDQMVMTITVDHDRGSAVAWPDSLDLGAFEVVHAEVLEPRENGDRIRSSARLTLTTFELGDLEIPSFEVAVRGADGTSTVLATDAFDVTIASVGRDESGDIRGIKGPLAIPLSWVLLVLWIVGALAAAGIAYWLYRRWRAGRQPAAAPLSSAPPRPPHEVAYAALDRLAASGLIERGEIKAFHIAVAEIVRTYVQARYRIDALEMATHEVLEALAGLRLQQAIREEFAGFLHDCDLVKFAKFLPPAGAASAMVPRARALVDRTREVEVVAAATEAAA